MKLLYSEFKQSNNVNTGISFILFTLVYIIILFIFYYFIYVNQPRWHLCKTKIIARRLRPLDLRALRPVQTARVDARRRGLLASNE